MRFSLILDAVATISLLDTEAASMTPTSNQATDTHSALRGHRVLVKYMQYPKCAARFALDEATPTKRRNFTVVDDNMLLRESLSKFPFEESQGDVMTVLLLKSFRFFKHLACEP
ncbi:hypothetical protein PsorP6_001954 [Peronosclerospora sorghi]|uniref:Uncharacterized protein n=1 Tax=Peronosclerospora sorghi TaxID=230839 RepID=A0ACC0WVD1_9STRA|nr:hypothetical protein PsorP6_001954 [Peronosclerospora sorghi]